MPSQKGPKICSTLFIYFSKTLIDKIAKSFNTTFLIFILLKISLKIMELIDQLNLLKHRSFLSITYRLIYRFCILSYYVVNNIILSKLNFNLLSDHFTKSFKSFVESAMEQKRDGLLSGVNRYQFYVILRKMT